MSWEEIHDLLDIHKTETRFSVIDTRPRYNIAPSQDVVIVRQIGDQFAPTMARWGFVPRDSRQLPSFSMSNARDDRLRKGEVRSFSRAFTRGQRCAFLMSGYYEWKSGKPYHIRKAGGVSMVVAGLWELNLHLKILSCAMITTEANRNVASIHPRMPVILQDTEAIHAWLCPSQESEANGRAMALLHPYQGSDLEFFRVGTYVNDPKNEGEKCVEPLTSDNWVQGTLF